MQYEIVDVAKYDGRCVSCGRSARAFEAVLLRDEARKWAVAHVRCAGVRTKNKIGGGRVIVAGPRILEA